MSGEIPDSLGNLSSLVNLYLDNNNLSGKIPGSLGNVPNLLRLYLNDNSLSGEISASLKTLTFLNDFRISDNRFSPDDLSSFVAGYGINDNGWSGRTFNIMVSPQNPRYPSGDTLIYGPLNPFRAIAYSGDDYSVEYTFTPENGNPIVQTEDILRDPPKEGNYTLQTTLTRTASPAYGSGVNELVFNGEVVISNRGLLDVLDENNKPTSRMSCDMMAELIGDDRVPLCYQYITFDSLSRPVVSNWDFFLPVDTDWMGIEIDNSNRVFSVVLANLGLEGAIAPELERLPNLNNLDFSNNELSGEIPSSLGNLSNLEFLQLNSNNLSGEIPSSLGNLFNLEFLQLNSNSLSGEIPSSLGNLSNLQDLHLNGNNLSGSIPDSLGTLPFLRSLSLNNNSLSGEIPNTLKTPNQLQALSIHNNSFLPDDLVSFAEGYGTTANGWSADNTFQTLIVSPQNPLHPEGDTLYYNIFNPFIRGVAYNGDGYSAEYRFTPSGGNTIVQSGNEFLTNPSAGGYTLETILRSSDYDSSANELVFSTDVLAVDDEIEVLDENNKPLSRAACDIMADIIFDDRVPLCYQYLSFTESSRAVISDWNFSNPINTSWTGITTDFSSGRITSINIGNHGLEGTIAPELEGLSDLRFLYLDNNNLSGEIPSELGNLSDLQFLWLYQNNLNGEIPSELGNLSDLNSLQLNGNNLSGEIPSGLWNLSSLQQLHLNDNNLSGEIPESIGNLSDLSSLQLNDNNLSGEIPDSLGNLSALDILNLDNNNLSGEIPESLGNLSGLNSLQLNSNNLSGEIPSSLGNLSNLNALHLDNNNLSGEIPDSLGGLNFLTTLHLDNNNLSGPIPNGFRSFELTSMRIDSNAFLPDDLVAFTLGYGTSQNGWNILNRFGSFAWSPQNPTHSQGDTLYYGLVPYINGLTYNGNYYSAEYAFTFEGDGSTIVQVGNAQLDNPTIGTYSLTTTLRRADAYGVANVLIFNTEVVVLSDGLDMGDLLDANNKPINLASCGRIEELITDNRVPLCYQYFAFDDSLRPILSDWDFSSPVDTSWVGITEVDIDNRIVSINLDSLGLAGTIAPELSRLSHLQTIFFRSNNLRGEIPSSLGNLPNLTTLYLDNNSLSGEIPASLGNLSNLTNLRLNHNNLSDSIPDIFKTRSIEEFLIDNNAFLPDDLGSFVAGYGTNENNWESNTFDSFQFSPQNPDHPEGDTLYYGLGAYVVGLVYNGNDYSVQYTFTPNAGDPIIQTDSVLNNPEVGTYTLKTTLTRVDAPVYEDGANELIFSTDVVVLNDDMSDVLDANNKPINRASCDRMAELI